MQKNVGVDGVEIHAAHGYLLNQFIKLYYNKRTDMYGGTFENRMRFVIEIYNSMRATVVSRFVLGFRLSVDEFIKDGNTFEDGIKMAKVFSVLGMDFIDVRKNQRT